MPTYWLLFADVDLPDDEQFLGACIVNGDDEDDAIQHAWRRGCNPGGEVMSSNISLFHDRIRPEFFNKILTKEQVEKEVYLKPPH